VLTATKKTHENMRGCAQCGKRRPVMVEMAPGHDKKPWWLCSGCYRFADVVLAAAPLA
jgi:hypothetical protein